ncbi:VanZ family protein [Halomonas sp. McH1-25]|uniref:VanZ family protein n=1 Tax=unclassified Halomonas TaxID=2609666 RepID=UPI001EF6DD1E|nr:MULTISPECIES: VanZ family protein [unclassified Halomonas]MCG7599546.1 VanZ family protein [Halomonas sp. McH1-25]MCP1342181.1 VanZ family protein [Halomonas sp. FL8]MCP1362779.1 VanZ family protein [Halomonas sp. BBD45]MCP1365857.1 VanZ family protein [Halomonas sp. BBD48]
MIWRAGLRDRRLWAAAAIAAAVAIAIGSLTPGDEMPQNLPWDKFNHFAGYAVLALLTGLAGWRGLFGWGVVSVYGVAIELAQTAVPGRLGADPADMLANALGAALGLLLLAAIRRTVLSRN